ncbi:amidohydrolase family protein [Subtercola endophyticus]|uniref:amidohydrolase family protein n=1 Tax=Subtercola endophyticus TaxID=2895559 RepID=UPI001E2B6093|nr:amidohydrolase family protein [Subtercola endophyticus]UFS58455.1 amidohydrolase family protein [Subtercola endophyticus]
MTTVIDNVHFFTGSSLTHPQRVAINESGRLDLTGTGKSLHADETIDGTGCTLLPGLIDAHMHTRARDDLAQLAHWGVTTGLDMAAWPVAFVDRMRHEKGVAQIRSAGIPAVGPGGNHARIPGFPVDGIVITPDEGRRFVELRFAEGSDYIKIITEAAPPEGMDQPTVDAIVTAAHDRGLLVIAHSVTTGAYRVALDAGVDIITHAPLDAVLDNDLVQRLRTANTVVIPTLTMMHGIASMRPTLTYEHARDSVRALHSAGVTILMGTDANSAPATPFMPKHGSSAHDELALLVAAGLSPTQALAASTSLTTREFKLCDRGVIAAGKRADLLLVNGDPTADIQATRNIQGVWIDGTRIVSRKPDGH